MQARSAPTDRTRVRRLPARGNYQRATIEAILDEGLIAHLGFVAAGTPVVLPVAYARDGDTLYIHGAVKAGWANALGAGNEVCLTVTLLDGLVLARSAFHHSMNYRSVVAFGVMREVQGDEKARALDRIVEHLVPGRGADARGASPNELTATRVLALSLDEASAKIRTGPPIDDSDDLALPVWAGVLPFVTSYAAPIADTPATIAQPDYVRDYRRP